MLDRTAVISPCGNYRYLLWRAWDHTKPRCLFIMLNPSTADHEIDDATIRSCMRLAKALGYGSIEVVNLMAWRATHPKDLPGNPYAAMGPDNAKTIEAAVQRCAIVICAWGSHPRADLFKNMVLNIINEYHLNIYCFGTTKNGSPKHPLYIKSGTLLLHYY
jgi:hypothetical protein